MDRDHLFWMLVLTAVLTISAIKQAANGERFLAAVLVAIPASGWLAIWLGR